MQNQNMKENIEKEVVKRKRCQNEEKEELKVIPEVGKRTKNDQVLVHVTGKENKNEVYVYNVYSKYGI